jgi:hypothetical protein
MYDATRTINNENKNYEREKRKLRENALGDAAKNVYKRLKQDIKN